MINKVILIGRIGKDPETRILESGVTISNFTLATSEKFKNKQGENVESTEWHNCQAWGNLAKIVNEYVKKGQLLYVEGKLKTETWEKEGSKHYKTLIIINEIKMLSGRLEEKSTSESNTPDPTDDLPF